MAGVQSKFLKDLQKTQGRKNPVVESSRWFNSLLNSRLNSNSNITDKQKIAGRYVKAPKLGELYFFQYKALGDGVLPYWDKQPVSLIIGRGSRSMLGLNFHYLPRRLRAQFLDKLIEIQTDEKYTVRTRSQATYQLLSAARRYKLFRPMIKRYNYSQIKSPLMKIFSDEWGYAVNLPYQKFKGASAQKVWLNS